MTAALRHTVPQPPAIVIAAGGTITLTFTDNSKPFAATDAAVAYLRAREFSVGPLQGDDPRAIFHGKQIMIGKWRSLSDAARARAHGTLTGDARTGPVIVTIFSSAPAAAREAVQRAA